MLLPDLTDVLYAALFVWTMFSIGFSLSGASERFIPTTWWQYLLVLPSVVIGLMLGIIHYFMNKR